jgi:hypothetical protein
MSMTTWVVDKDDFVRAIKEFLTGVNTTGISFEDGNGTTDMI